MRIFSGFMRFIPKNRGFIIVVILLSLMASAVVWDNYFTERARESAPDPALAAKIEQDKQAAKRLLVLRVNEFRDHLQELDPERRLLVGVANNGTIGYIEVTDAWHLLHYQVRLQTAQDLLKIWRSHLQDEAAILFLVDHNGNKVSGMNWGEVTIPE